MAPKRIRALDFREPAPEYEFADGTVAQLHYLDAGGFQLLTEYEADDKSAEKLAALLLAIAPTLSIAFIDKIVTFRDVVTLIGIAKGHVDVVLDALKNGPGGEDSSPKKTDPPPRADPDTQDSNTMTPSPPSSPE